MEPMLDTSHLNLN